MASRRASLMAVATLLCLYADPLRLLPAAGVGGEVLAQAPDTKGAKRKAVAPKRKDEPDAAAPAPDAPPMPGTEAAPASPRPGAPAPGTADMKRESIEADVSTRSIAVTSGFTGTEIIVFGSIDNSRQPSAEAGYYDVVVVVEGAPAALISRRKSNVAGLWINTAAAAFDRVPSYYAIASTRPLEEIADTKVLEENAIGFDYVRLIASLRTAAEVPASELREFRDAVVRIKQADDLYLKNDYGVAFIGRSLFRSSIELPANVPVGPLTARVFLFHEGELLSKFSTRVRLEREGIELLLYRFAFRQPLLYGLFAVAVAIGAGLLASALFRRPIQ